MEALAREALEFFSGGEAEDAIALRRQLAQGRLVEIDYTGAGFFVRIETPESAPRLSQNGVMGDVEPARGGEALAALLFVTNGSASSLEVVAYGDWPEDLTGFSCHYLRWDTLGEDGRAATPVTQRDAKSMWS